ncbi:M23/M37 family peptidase [Desmospora sp. 8437]|nr:M23/M37 family peptidase [Desmospora sp. 8437]
MKTMAKRWLRWSALHRKGAASVEFVTILPLALLLAMAVWQLALVGAAIMDTHSAVRDAVKIASMTGDSKFAEKEGKKSFGDSSAYDLKSLKVKIKGEDVTASAETKIPVLFMKNTPFSYTSSSEAPVLAPPPDDQFAAFGGLGGGPLPTGGGSLANPVAVAPGCGITCYSGHTGQDFPGAVGTPIVAAEAGTVTVRHLGNRSYGTYIIIDHGGGMQTLYAHMFPHQPLVKTGDRVKRGQPIGAIGNNGNSSGPHLHFEVKIGGRPVDPIPFLAY